MGKSIHFSGQPLYSQVIKLLDKSKILQISRKYGGEHYVKRFDGWTHLVVMLYAIIMRFDSLREIMASIQAEARKLCHLGITTMPSRSTLSDANKRRPEIIFESIYRELYTTYRNILSSDSRQNCDTVWMKRLQIIDSTTITLFSNLLFKGVGRHPKTGKKKGGIKVHTVIHANAGGPSDIKFTSAATNDSFMLRPSVLNKGDIIAINRAYIDYEKLEALTQREVMYVTKMKKNLKYKIIEDCMYQTAEGLMKGSQRSLSVRSSAGCLPGTIGTHCIPHHQGSYRGRCPCEGWRKSAHCVRGGKKPHDDHKVQQHDGFYQRRRPDRHHGSDRIPKGAGCFPGFTARKCSRRDRWQTVGTGG